ncbi:MAG: hypothetical protein KC643_28980 [Nitrospira sp.]|nr:hypothetical protein [Nitrospira sp.]MCA9481262.1 hypothetical protein [Nitrospira sp.]
MLLLVTGLLPLLYFRRKRSHSHQGRVPCS